MLIYFNITVIKYINKILVKYKFIVILYLIKSWGFAKLFC